MLKKKFEIHGIPAILWGTTSDKLYLYVHGQGGNKEEAEAFALIACPNSWQVISIDLPEHGERKNVKDSFNPWHVVPELSLVMEYIKSHWSQTALYANSIGAWFSMLSFKNEPFVKCLFVSPILDMNHLISTMMTWANVTEEQLEAECTVPTSFGQTLSWKYLQYARNHSITKWNPPTQILYGEKDNLTGLNVLKQFTDTFHCKVIIMENGEHWFHTPQQLQILNHWVEQNFRN